LFKIGLRIFHRFSQHPAGIEEKSVETGNFPSKLVWFIELLHKIHHPPPANSPEKSL